MPAARPSTDEALGAEALGIRRAWGRRIREARVAAGLSQRDVFDRFGIAQSTVSGWESRDNDMSLATMQRIAATLGASSDDGDRPATTIRDLFMICVDIE